MSATKRATYHLFASICQGLFGLISITLVIPALSNKELGYVAALETLTYFFANVAGLNLDRAASRFYFNREDSQYRWDVFSTLNTVAFLSIILSVLLVLVLRGAVVCIFPDVPFWPLVTLALARVSLEIAGRIEQSYLIASGQSKRYALGIILSGATNVGLSVVLVTIYKYGVIGFLAAQLSAALLLLIYLFIASMQNRGSGKFDLRILSSALSYAWPFIPTLIVAWVLSYYDRVLINRFLGIEKLGIYALATMMASPFLLVSGAVTKTILPTFYSVYGTVEGTTVTDYRLEFSRAVIHIFGCTALFALTVGSVLLEILLGSRVEQAMVYFGFIVVIYWVNSVVFLPSELLMLAKATKLNMMVSILLAILSLILNYWLIQQIGIIGAIVSGLTAAIVGFIAHLYVACRFMPMRFSNGAYIYVLLVLLATATITVWFKDWQSKFILLLIGGVIFSRGTLNGIKFLRRHG